MPVPLREHLRASVGLDRARVWALLASDEGVREPEPSDNVEEVER